MRVPYFILLLVCFVKYNIASAYIVDSSLLKVKEINDKMLTHKLHVNTLSDKNYTKVLFSHNN